MSFFAALSAIGMPLAMVFGAIAAWRLLKKEKRNEQEQPTWRDTSLDDWRRERDASADAERAARASEPNALLEGSAEEREEARRHQRIGG
jgi:hypothetical protein